MLHNKESIEKKIRFYRLALELESYIKETVNKFRRYKKVDKRFAFINALNKREDCNAYIKKDNCSTKLVISLNNAEFRNYEDRVQFSVYVSHYPSLEPLNWDEINKALILYGYQECLNNYLKMKEVYEQEFIKFTELYDLIKDLKFQCFSLTDIKYKFEDMINYAKE